ncbi:PPC domain-containing DNA-binding protein [Dysosmobacter sp. Sow4_B12]|uniref:PPC domain-containing DNA-binding protein n=1 Tax=Dysosmobacter sp. Sow4_B12 TaxID=3438777 RepID=UPI003F913B2A
MTNFVANEYGRLLVVHLRKGDLLLESIQKALDENGIKNAVLLSAIGSLRKLSMHIILDTEDNANNSFLVVEKPFELCAMQGLVLDGVPHFHMVCSAPGNESFCGHVEPGCEVQYLMEISLMEVKDMDLTRRKDEFGIDYIDKL